MIHIKRKGKQSKTTLSTGAITPYQSSFDKKRESIYFTFTQPFGYYWYIDNKECEILKTVFVIFLYNYMTYYILLSKAGLSIRNNPIYYL